MSIRPHMRLDHGIFQLKMQALNLRKDGVGIKDIKRRRGKLFVTARVMKAKLT